MTTSDVIIVIGRQFGSGGRALGLELSRRLSVPFYDKELLTESARQFGISLPELEKQDERKPSIFRSMVESAFGMPAAGNAGTISSSLYAIQSHVIEELAKRGGAVFVGRTADYVLRNNPRLLSVFVCADDDIRTARIVRRGDCKSIESALDLARRKDKLRQNYYNFFTGRSWGTSSNYHLSIDVGRLGLDAATDIVMQAAYALSKKSEF